MKYRFSWILLAGLVLALAVLPSTLNAQTAGRITGQVLDARQAGIPGALVTAENVATGAKRQIKTDDIGRYMIAELSIGIYNLRAEAAGFQAKVREKVIVNVATTVDVDFVLPTGQITERIEVVATAQPIETTGATTGSTMENQQLIELPINGRDYARFSLLVPGALARTNYIADLSFNGLHTVHNQYQIDGIDASRVDQPYMSNGWERGSRLLTGSLDTIAEFRVQTSNYQAQYGRASGSYINIATKSGTNDIHGTVFEFFRNSALDARNFFATTGAKPAYRFNDFGGNIGGPIRKDKTFFFVNYEGSRQRIGITGAGTVPSALLRSQVLTTSPALAPIVGMFPLGTSPTSNPLIDNYTTTKTSQIREDTGSVRIDQSFGDKDSLFVRVNVNDSHVFGALFGVTASALGNLDFQNVPVRTTNVAIHEQHIFSPNLINEFLAGAQRWGGTLISDVPYPLTTITGLTVVPGDRGRSIQNATSAQMGDTVSMTRGAHSIKWGGTIYRIIVNRLSKNTSSMTYTSIDDFINNQPATATLSVGDPGHTTLATQIGLFVQDTFRLRSNLTIDYGLRYDYETVPHDKHNATQTFDTRTGALAAPGTPYFRANKNDWGPRFAIAWQPTSRLIVRSGYGIFWQAYPVGFGSYSVPRNNIPGNTTMLRVQIPDLSYPFTRFLSQGTAPLPAVAGFDWIKRDIYAQQWNVSIATQITDGTAFQIAYIGNHGLNLRRNRNINFYDPALGRRPNPNFSDVAIEGNTGQNIYHALQASFKRRFTRGLHVDFEYSFAHAIDDVQDQGLWSAQPQDNNNFKAERGNSSGDIRHNVAFNVLYELPMGSGHRFLGSLHGVPSVLVSGWKVAALGLLRSGVASTVYIGTNTYGNRNYTNQRPNAVVGVSPYPADKSITNWLNPAAFSMPAAGTFGNLGRNTIYGPHFRQVDVSLLKDFKISEGVKLQYRAEFFNLPNHPNFDQPNTTFGTSAFGKIFNTFGRTLGIGTSRQIQMALKLTF